jgi:hypothetical protein
MARIRTIKPEFFTSEDIVSRTPLARILYIALWCEADREGRMEWKPKTIKLRYLPGDDCDVSILAQELIDAEMLVLYQADGVLYAAIPSFTKHQIINNREAPSKIPPRVDHASHTRQTRVKAEGKEGKEGKEIARVDDDGPDSTSAPPAVALIPLIDGSDFEVYAEKANEWSAAYPAVNVPQRLMAIRQWCIANPTNRKTRRGVEGFIVRWLSKDQDSGRGGRDTSSPNVPLQLIGGV